MRISEIYARHAIFFLTHILLFSSVVGSCVDYSARDGSGIPNLAAQQQSQQQGNSLQPQQPQQQPQAQQPQGQQHVLSQQPPPPASNNSQSPPPPPPPITITKSPQCGSLPLGYADIPNECDFLYASSCVPGYISWTNTASGSWYITALATVLLSYWPTMHLGQLKSHMARSSSPAGASHARPHSRCFSAALASSRLTRR